VIAGTFYFGTGDEIRRGKAHTLTAGAFHFLSGNDRHYLVARSQAVVQVNSNGPFDIHYVDPDGEHHTAKQ
jgi:hypothetical protein